MHDDGISYLYIRENSDLVHSSKTIQESRAVARKPRDAAAVCFGLKFADNIHYKFKSSRASKKPGFFWSSIVTLVLSCLVSEILQVF